MSGGFVTTRNVCPLFDEAALWADKRRGAKKGYKAHADDYCIVFTHFGILVSPKVIDELGRPKFVDVGYKDGWLLVRAADEGWSIYQQKPHYWAQVSAVQFAKDIKKLTTKGVRNLYYGVRYDRISFAFNVSIEPLKI